MHKNIIFILTIAVATLSACYSTNKFSSSDISPLKGQKEVNVVINFSEMLVNNQPEESHIEYNTKDKNAEETAQWLKEWNEDLRLRSYNLLINALDHHINKNGLLAGNHPNAEYTIYVKVKNINTGYFAGIMNKPSKIQSDVSFVRTGETTPFATISYNMPGLQLPYHVERIALSFKNLGYDLGRKISKNLE